LACARKGIIMGQGLLQVATIKNYTDNNRIEIIIGSSPRLYTIDMPYSLFYDNGICIGSLPAKNSQILVEQALGGSYYFVSFLNQKSGYAPSLHEGELLIKSSDNTQITLHENDIVIGAPSKGDDFNEDINDPAYNRLHINTKHGESLINSSFSEIFNFTQASRNVNGLIKRDLANNNNYPVDFQLTTDDIAYTSTCKIIGLNPEIDHSKNSGGFKNPAFIEQRELIYEFEYDSNILNDFHEQFLYAPLKLPIENNVLIPRRSKRSDTLSLTLASPNYLIETIKGTVVDIYGNILDLNRLPLPIKKIENNNDAEKFSLIKELERKSIAYHFELNARKDLSKSKGGLPNIDSNADYARDRSRFFIDIDKEGQFKINVPASSEKGNVPVLTRYENKSTFYENNDPNNLIPFSNEGDNIDIYLDSFAAPFVNNYKIDPVDLTKENRGSISIKDLDADALPNDRITKKSIKHGTAYHDILATCYSFLEEARIAYGNEVLDPTYKNIDVKSIMDSNKHLEKIVTNEIKINGNNANAGGRSGSINLDGSLELNIGANTIDRQSLWVDTAGGMVANIGMDNSQKSLAMNLDGNVYIQIGSTDITSVSTDSRFSNNIVEGIVDIRVLGTGIFSTMIRIDKEGIKIMTPQNLSIHCGQNINITSDATIRVDSEHLILQGREVMKEFAGSI
jgi:hypothetical protein